MNETQKTKSQTARELKGPRENLASAVTAAAAQAGQGASPDGLPSPSGGDGDASPDVRLLFEEGAVGMAIAGPDGRVLQVNRVFGEMLGYSPDELVGRHPAEFTHPDDCEVSSRQLEHILRGEAARYGLEKRYVRKDGQVVWVRATVNAVRDRANSVSHLLVIVENIVEQKRAERLLQCNEEWLRGCFEQGLIGMAIISTNAHLLKINDFLCNMVGYSREELVSMTWEDLTHPDDLAEGRARFQRILTGELDSYSAEKRFLRKDGNTIHVKFSCTRVRPADEAADYFVCLIDDISQRCQTEEALRQEQQLLKQLLDVQVRERKVLAFEIHDQLMQQLTGALMHFQSFDDLREHKPDPHEKLFQMGLRVLRAAAAESSRLMAGLRPPILDQFGVVEAIQYLVTELKEQRLLNVVFSHDVRFDRLTASLEHTIFRIVQEGLTNACRHSGSKKVRVQLTQHAEQILIKIEDRGMGFDPEKVPGKRLGLPGIRERAQLFGGKATIDSAPGKGTRILVGLPLLESTEPISIHAS